MRAGISVMLLSLTAVGCAHMMPVVTLESAIRDAAQAAQRAVGPASDKVTVQVSVVTATSAGTKLPIPVVPLDIAHTRTQTTMLTLDVDLRKFKLPLALAAPSRRYLLNLKTGELNEIVEKSPETSR